MHWFCFSSNQLKNMHTLHFFAIYCSGQGKDFPHSKCIAIVTDKTQKYIVSSEGITTLNKYEKNFLKLMGL